MLRKHSVHPIYKMSIPLTPCHFSLNVSTVYCYKIVPLTENPEKKIGDDGMTF